LHAAVAIRDTLDGRRIALEASGGIDIGNIRAIADTGVDFISIGATTKNVTAIDFSMRFL
jgi:nicotinate-nucleotide pyrophosphorylase (carboxylating)